MLRFLYSFAVPWAKANPIQIFCNRLLGGIANIFYPIWCRIIPVKNREKEKGVIISVTSYPARIGKCYLCMESLLRQDVRAEKIILWLAKDQFPDKRIPTRLKELQEKGLEIRYCEDLRSYKKFFFAAKEYSECRIVTADDDMLYPEDWLRRLLARSAEYPSCVVCYRAHKMRFYPDGSLKPYLDWDGLSPDYTGPSHLLLATGGCGILYPPGFFSAEDLDKDIIQKLCPLSDDLWLKIHELYKEIPVVKVGENSLEWFTIYSSQKKSLMEENVGKGENDCVIKRLIDYYQIDTKSLSQL